jgi:D-alanyl-D-alanine carboxypeptidase (penicillin-binding protein 5/6)
VVDADSGETLFADHAEALIYPASVLKMMVLLVILEKIEAGTLNPGDMVQVTKEAAQMGGSQVYLDPAEQFSVEDLLYALMVQSANDAAVALAIHVAGSKERFVALMNQRAAQLGMSSSTFYSVHGLPPSEGQKPDTTTAIDLAILSRELAKRPEVFNYTGAKEREFRDGTFIMRTHNHLLKTVDGCDGFKTGYFKAAGFSIVATAKRNGVRIIAIVLGSQDRKIRDAKASELLTKGFSLVPPKPENKTIQSKPQKTEEQANPERGPVQPKAPPPETKRKNTAFFLGNSLIPFCLGFVAGAIACSFVALYLSSRRRKKPGRLS